MTIEETLYAEWYASQTQESREARFERLLEHLQQGAASFGIHYAALAEQIRRKRCRKKQPNEPKLAPEAEAADLIAKIEARRSGVLRRVLEIDSGNWRKDIESFLEGAGRVGLDDLFMLASVEADNLWVEVMERIMFRRVWNDRHDDLAGRRRDAVCDTLSGMVLESRALLTCAIVSPAEGITPPVCLGYCRRGAGNLLLKDNVHFQQIVEYDETTRDDSAAEAPEVDAIGADTVEEPAGSERIRTRGEAVVIYNQMGTEEQSKLRNQAWDRLRPADRSAIWLSKRMQKPDMAGGLPDTTPALPHVPLGSNISGEEAARLLGLPNKNAFFQCVNRANRRYEALFISHVKAFLEEGNL